MSLNQIINEHQVREQRALMVKAFSLLTPPEVEAIIDLINQNGRAEALAAWAAIKESNPGTDYDKASAAVASWFGGMSSQQFEAFYPLMMALSILAAPADRNFAPVYEEAAKRSALLPSAKAGGPITTPLALSSGLGDVLSRAWADPKTPLAVGAALAMAGQAMKGSRSAYIKLAGHIAAFLGTQMAISSGVPLLTDGLE